MNTSNNARSRNTEKLLEETYLYLISRHPERPVNVVEICTRANVNRATFYAHYTDILHLQEKIESEMVQEMKDLFRNPELGENIMTVSRMTMVLQSIKKHKAFYDAWYKSGRDEGPSLVNRFMSTENTPEARYNAMYCKAGINAIIKDWLKHNCDTNPAQLASIIIGLSK